jgi:hypothetical protein
VWLIMRFLKIKANFLKKAKVLHTQGINYLIKDWRLPF